jgi:DNA-binding phage protein
MALTRSFKETVKARAERDPEFRAGILEEAIEALLHSELDVCKLLLRDYVNATIGFEALAKATHKSLKSLMRMLSADGNPRADNLFSVIAHLLKNEGIALNIRPRRGETVEPGDRHGDRAGP